MLSPDKSKTLIEAFLPDCVENGNRDNIAGWLVDGLARVLLNITMCKQLDDTKYIHPQDIKSICDTIEWFEDIFSELDENGDTAQPYDRTYIPKRITAEK